MACLQSVAAPGTGATLLVGLVLLACTLAALPLTLFLVRSVSPRRAATAAGWGLRSVLGVAGFAFLSMLIMGQALAQRAQLAGTTPPPRDVRVELAAMAAVLVLVCAYAVWIARRAAPGGGRALGLTLAGLPRSVAGAVLAYLLCAPGLLGVMLLWTSLLRAAGVQELEQPIARELATLPAGDRPLAFALGVLVLPFCEELLFRGFLQASIERVARPFVAVAITSVLFAALHPFPQSVPIFALSLILGGVVLRTRNLCASWSVHALHNGIMFALLWFGPEQWRSLSEGS